MQTRKLKLIPLGGLGEFGMNCLALHWEDDIIVIDAGLMFPETELLGVDIVVPDISYLVENKEHVRAIILTHGHEDHIGGLPWILSELKVPVYATEFTLAYVEGKLEEHELLDETTLIEITPREKFSIGPFTIEPIRVTHSLVDCVALAIETPVGIIIHTGDFKVDLAPLDDKAFDLHTFTENEACLPFCRIQQTSSAPDIRLVSAPSFRGCMRSSRKPRRSSSSVVSRPPSTASASPSSWPANTAAKPWSSAVR